MQPEKFSGSRPISSRHSGSPNLLKIRSASGSDLALAKLRRLAGRSINDMKPATSPHGLVCQHLNHKGIRAWLVPF